MRFGRLAHDSDERTRAGRLLPLADSSLTWLDEERERVMLAHQLVIQAERAKVSLESQLSQYQRVLTEQAESLAEERA